MQQKTDKEIWRALGPVFAYANLKNSATYAYQLRLAAKLDYKRRFNPS